MPPPLAPGKYRSTVSMILTTSKAPHISRITQCLSLCNWLILLSIMTSTFIHVVACVWFFLFLRLTNISLVYTKCGLCVCIYIYIKYIFGLSIRSSMNTWDLHFSYCERCCYEHECANTS